MYRIGKSRKTLIVKINFSLLLFGGISRFQSADLYCSRSKLVTMVTINPFTNIVFDKRVKFITELRLVLSYFWEHKLKQSFQGLFSVGC